MEIVLAAVCDAANVSQEGKLNILGIFDRIGSNQFPTRHPHMSFAFRIRAEYEDQGRTHRLRVTLIDQDGSQLWGGSANIDVSRVAPGEYGHINQVISLSDVKFKGPGRYRFRIQLGDKQPHDTVFSLAKAEPTTP